MKFNPGYVLFILAFLLFAGCQQETEREMPDTEIDTEEETENNVAVAVLSPTEGNNVTGKVTFTKTDDGIKVIADIEGLTPGKHGFHIHEKGDCSAPDASSAGGHFAPMGTSHGAPTDSARHAGDMGNIEADKDGKVRFEWLDKVMTFDGNASIIGKAVIVHEKEDDLKTQPTGNAGARVACGVIEWD